MPQFQTTTKQSRSVWKTPDGQREIFEVVLDYDGQDFKGKTYSKDIAVIGWAGTVDTYEKEGRNGSETFVKQPPKEGFGGGSSTTQGAGHAPSVSKPAFDNFTMYLSYAKDIAVAMLGKDGKLDQVAYGEVLNAVSNGGKTLFDERPDAPKKSEDESILDDVKTLFPED